VGAASERPGFAGSGPDTVSPTFRRRGVRERPDAESTGPKDDREPVNDTHNRPWRMVCALTITGQSGGTVPGTGWLVGPRTVITAGHCLFDPVKLDGAAVSVRVTPGMNGGAMPFGQFSASRFRTLPSWEASGDPDFDLGAMRLEASPGNAVGFFAMAALAAADLESKLAHVSGYPHLGGSNVRQFHHRNRIVTASRRRLFYETDTSEGQSGAPVWILEADGGTPKVVGVHTYGFDKSPPGLPPSNSATLVTTEVLAQIERWVEEDAL
jgi:glutamyl endopeptidase